MTTHKSRNKGHVVTYENDNDTVRFKKKNKIRKRGRPKKKRLLPASEEARIKKQEKENLAEDDELIQQLNEDPSSIEVFDAVMRELAVENASLKFERREAERKGESTTKISSKRTTAIKAIGEIFSKRRSEMVGNAIDFNSEQFDRLTKFFFGKIRTAAENSGFSEEKIGILFNKIASLFDDDTGWKQEAKKFVRQDDE